MILLAVSSYRYSTPRGVGLGQFVTATSMSTDERSASEAAVRMWLVERTYGDDEQNMIILTHATPDGRHGFRKERALTASTGDHRDTPVSMAVDPGDAL